MVGRERKVCSLLLMFLSFAGKKHTHTHTKNLCNQERGEISEEKAVGEERVSQALGAELKKDEGAVKREAEKEPRNKNMLGI